MSSWFCCFKVQFWSFGNIGASGVFPNYQRRKVLDEENKKPLKVSSYRAPAPKMIMCAFQAQISFCYKFHISFDSKSESTCKRDTALSMCNVTSIQQSVKLANPASLQVRFIGFHIVTLHNQLDCLLTVDIQTRPQLKPQYQY